MTAEVIGRGTPDGRLDDAQVYQIVAQGLDSLPIAGRRLLVIVPDGTRTLPMPLLRHAIDAAVGDRATRLDYLVALGTHPPMSDAQLTRRFGSEVVDGWMGRSRIHNHRWNDPEALSTLGTIGASEMRALSGGRLDDSVAVSINHLVFDYDQLLICGPVFPHEVVGFSGGLKYLFPGIAGRAIIDATHWLGALIGNYHVIGSADTPVRAVIDRAADMLDRPLACLALVVTHDHIVGAYIGPTRAAWRCAAALSARTHIVQLARPVRRALAVLPEMYEDLWTAAKGMYKLEPVVADGGEVVLYAPHITEVSYTHGAVLDEIGYHCRDYFLAHWERFGSYPAGILAHSTHLTGLGRYDAATGVETPRIQVTLATGIPEARCRHLNLGYCHPRDVRPDEWAHREAEGILLVPRAGETLYRLANTVREERVDAV